MSRLQEIRKEAIAQEAYWRSRRIGSLRVGLIEARDAGMSPAEAATYLGMKRASVYSACCKYRIKLHRYGRPFDPNPRVEVRKTIRETAIANRGKASAAQIAAAIGVTRNSIIGHWNRAKVSA